MNTTREQDTVGVARSFLLSLTDLMDVKGVALLVYLSAITGASAVLGVRDVAEGLPPGVALTLLLLLSVVAERSWYDRTDHVGVVATGLAAVYTAVEYVGVLQYLWFPVAAALLLLAAAGYRSWTEGVSTPAEFVEHLDIVGLYGGILLLVYSLILWGGQLGFIYSRLFPAILLMFVVSLLVTTLAYATRSTGIGMPSDELHRRLVSVVRGLDDVDDDEDWERLGSHVLAVSQALSGFRIPSRVTVSEGPVPVVLPDTDPMETQPRDVWSLLGRLNGRRFTGYVVDENGNVVLFRDGSLRKAYLADEGEYVTDKERLGDVDGFRDVRVYTAPYGFIDSVDSITPGGGASEEWAEEAVDRVEDLQDMGSLIVDGEEVMPDAEAAAEAGAGTETEPEPEAEAAAETETDVESDDDEDEEEAEPKETPSSDESTKLNVGGDEIDLDEMFEKADEMFD